MITLYDFNAMDEQEQAATVWETGNYLSDRPDGELMVQLYSLESFYVEVFYNMKENKITGFRGFKSNQLLVPYITGNYKL